MEYSNASSRRSSEASPPSSSRQSSHNRLHPNKRPSVANIRPPTPSDKSLTSFPSLSPSPEAPTRTRPQDGALVSGKLPIARTIVTAERPNKALVESLTTSSRTGQDRSALFDESPKHSTPGSLGHASDAEIKKLMQKNGAIALIRQLAEDLAQRDAEVTTIKRRAEERERVLRSMLLDCEVSTFDVDAKLRSLESSTLVPLRQQKSRNTSGESLASGLGPSDSMNERLSLAMSDVVGDETVTHVANAARRKPRPESESGDDDDGRSVTSKKGWTEYIWSATGTRKKSGNLSSNASIQSDEADEAGADDTIRARVSSKQGRGMLDQNTFQPPLIRTVSATTASSAPAASPSEPETKASRPRSSTTSTSNAGWTTRLFGGPAKIHKSQLSRDSATSIEPESGSSRTASKAYATHRTSGSNTGPSPNQRQALLNRSIRTGNLNTSGIRNITPDSIRTTGSGRPESPQIQSPSALGPVEMDAILPEESRPPTLTVLDLTQNSDYLTDPFGFIYDQNRKKRQSQAAAALRNNKRNSKVESIASNRDLLVDEEGDGDSPLGLPEVPAASSRSSLHAKDDDAANKWYDFLKLATNPGELLAYTPSRPPLTEVDVNAAPIMSSTDGANNLKSPAILVDHHGSVPDAGTISEPSATRITVSSGGFITSAGSGPDTSKVDSDLDRGDPVRSLLRQIKDSHDQRQREKTARWNDFLRKVRAERATNSDSRFATMPENSLANGEVVGITSLGNKGKVGQAKWKEFKRLVLGGVPVALRPKIWAECSGANALRVPGSYEELVRDDSKVDPSVAQQIQMDITRTLTDNIYYRNGPGVQRLQEVLLAYAKRNPELGYCQGMNLIAACLLLVMPTAEDAFWILTSMVETILPSGYYDTELLTSRADQTVLRQLVAEILPKLSVHLEELGIELEALTFQWFLSIFTDCLSAEALFRVWDLILCAPEGGSTFLFQVALALLKLNEKNLLEEDSAAGIYHYINHQMTNHAITIDGLVQASEALRKVVKKQDVEQRRKRAVEQDLELVRQREEIRSASKGKKKATDDGADSHSPAGGSASHEYLQEYVPAIHRTLSSDEDSDLPRYNELEVKTPMPMEEEALWRA